MKYYIAGKITGLEDYKSFFNAVEKELKDQGHLVMNPAVLPEGFPWESYMPICYAMIDACDAVYMLDNWKESAGARLEYDYSVDKGKLISMKCPVNI